MALDRSGPVFYAKVGNAGAAAATRIPVDIRLISLSFTEDEAKQDTLALTVDNHDLANFDTPLFAVGNVVEAAWGYPGAMSRVRECSITKITGSLQLKVECKGKSHVANLIAKSRTFDNMRRSDVAVQIAKEHGAGQFGLDIIVDDTPVTFDRILQVRETDQAFLRRLAGKEGFDYYEDQSGFHFHARRVGDAPIRRFTYFTDPGGGDVESFNVEGDITSKPALIIAAGRDPLLKENFAPYSDDKSQPGRVTNAPVPIVAVNDAFAYDLASIAKARANATSAGTHTMASTAGSKADAQAQANAAQTRSTQKAVKVTIHCVGDATIEAKQTVELKGFGRTLDGNYHVSNVQHKLGPGYKMTLKLTRDGVGSKTGFGANDPNTDGKVNSASGPNNTNTSPFAVVNDNFSVSWRTSGQRPPGK